MIDDGISRADRRLDNGRRSRRSRSQLGVQCLVDGLEVGLAAARTGDGWIKHGERRVFVRATPSDFDGWAALGNDAWSFAKVLPFLKRMEDDRDFPDAEVHGAGGPMPVSRPNPSDLHALSTAFVSACEVLTFLRRSTRTRPALRDLRRLPMNVIGGMRVNAAMAYIAPNRRRGNLTIKSGVTARRLVMNGVRAVAVEVERSGSIETFEGEEIVLVRAP